MLDLEQKQENELSCLTLIDFLLKPVNRDIVNINESCQVASVLPAFVVS